MGGSDGTTVLFGDPIRLTPAVVEFDDRKLGTASSEVPIVVSNRDDESHAVIGTGLAGDDAAHFDLTSDSCTGVTLAPAQSCEVRVRFRPRDAVEALAAAFVESDAATTPHIALLAGVGLEPPRLTVAPGNLSFGTTAPGSQSEPEVVIARNEGELPIWIEGSTITGSHSGWFERTLDGCPGFLDPGDSCTTRVRFRPPGYGSVSAMLVFTGDAANTPVAVSLSGATPPQPGSSRLEPAQGELDFGSRRVGSTTEMQMRLEKQGPGSLTLTRLVPTGIVGLSATQHGCIRVPLASGATCVVRVRFSPQRAGPHWASVSLTTARGVEHGRFDVTGTGVAPLRPKQPRGPLARQLSAAARSWRSAHLGAIVKRGLRLRRLDVTSPGKARVDLRARGRPGGPAVLIARGAHRFGEAGTSDILVRVTKRGRKLLRLAERLRVKVELRFLAKGGETTTVRTSLALRR